MTPSDIADSYHYCPLQSLSTWLTILSFFITGSVSDHYERTKYCSGWLKSNFLFDISFSIFLNNILALSAEAPEYTYCTSAEG